MSNTATLTPDNTQIVLCFEKHQMSPEQISEDLGYDLGVVKQILLQCSQAYYKMLFGSSKDSIVADENLFSKDDAIQAAQRIKGLAESAELETVKFRANQHIIDEYKGRNDIKALANQSFTATMLNDIMNKAREAMRRAESKAIELRQNSTLVEAELVQQKKAA